jgi:hypothetical protein
MGETLAALESKIETALMFMPGRHIYFNVNGKRVSLSVLSRVSQSVIRNGLRCQQCDAPIQPVIRVRVGEREDRERISRTDRRYCSNACRQRAYRKRHTDAS